MIILTPSGPTDSSLGAYTSPSPNKKRTEQCPVSPQLRVCPVTNIKAVHLLCTCTCKLACMNMNIQTATSTGNLSMRMWPLRPYTLLPRRRIVSGFDSSDPGGWGCSCCCCSSTSSAAMHSQLGAGYIGILLIEICGCLKGVALGTCQTRSNCLFPAPQRTNEYLVG
jgi:hypothetical protein